MLSEALLLACKELLDDAMLGCADLVFKDICLEILAKAKQVLAPEQFEELSFYAAERIKEKRIRSPRKRVKIQ
jgi:dsDNA-binding SOS-regulon protein